MSRILDEPSSATGNKTKVESVRLGRLKYLMRNMLRSFLVGCLGGGYMNTCTVHWLPLYCTVCTVSVTSFRLVAPPFPSAISWTRVPGGWWWVGGGCVNLFKWSALPGQGPKPTNNTKIESDLCSCRKILSKIIAKLKESRLEYDNINQWYSITV